MNRRIWSQTQTVSTNSNDVAFYLFCDTLFWNLTLFQYANNFFVHLKNESSYILKKHH